MNKFWIAFALGLGLVGCGSSGQNPVESSHLLSATTPPVKSSAQLQVPVEFYFYLNADNDIISTNPQGKTELQGRVVYQQLQNLAKTAPDQTAFHFYFDSNSKIEPAASGVERMDIVNGAVVRADVQGEADSSDLSHLDELLSVQSFKSSIRVLVMWGHGKGWRPVREYDFSSAGSQLNPADLAQHLRGKNLDLVIFDACAMAYIEVAQLFEGVVPYLMASQFELPVSGVSYQNLAKHLEDLSIAGTTDRNEIIRKLYQRLNKDTIDDQNARYQFAPLLLLNLNQFAPFREEFNRLYEQFFKAITTSDESKTDQNYRRVAIRSRPTGFLLFPNDRITGDIRGFAAATAQKLGLSPEKMLERYEAFSLGGYGSVDFFFPEEMQPVLNDQAAQDVKDGASRWAGVLSNWR